MTSERLGEMFKGDSADMCTKQILLVSMGEQADLSSVHRRGARTPIGASENYLLNCSMFSLIFHHILKLSQAFIQVLQKSASLSSFCLK